MLGQHFLIPYAVRDTNKISTHFLIDNGTLCCIIYCDTFTKIEKTQPIVVTPLEMSFVAANEQTKPIEGKMVIQSAFDVEYTFIVEQIFYVSDSVE